MHVSSAVDDMSVPGPWICGSTDGYHATAMRDSYDVLCDVGARSVKLINDAANDKNLVVSSMEEFIQRQIGTVRARAAGFVSMSAAKHLSLVTSPPAQMAPL